jgi:hypothetical protein
MRKDEASSYALIQDSYVVSWSKYFLHPGSHFPPGSGGAAKDMIALASLAPYLLSARSLLISWRVAVPEVHMPSFGAPLDQGSRLCLLFGFGR